MNTNVTTSYWEFETGEVKCFSHDLISSKNLEKLFTTKISKTQIDKLKQLDEIYEDLLNKYKDYTKLSQKEIKILVYGYRKRIDSFEKLMKNI